MSSLDRIIRIVIAAVFATLYFSNVLSGTLGLVLMILGVVFVLTSFVSFCPIYAVFGISTCKVPAKQ